MQPILSMRHISKSFFNKSANEDVSLDIYPGEIHALLGENGAGKTTLMNILYGVYTPDAGTVSVHGEDVRFSAPKDAIEHKIGMVHQHFMLVPNLTVSQNISLGLQPKGYPFTDRAAVNETLREISERYGLSIRADARVSELSVGEQQRVEIMKLLYRSVEILILDEPTAVLTPKETADFFGVLEKLKADGKSILIITHRIPEVMAISDRVTVLRDGRVVSVLERQELTEEKLSQLMIGRALNAPERKMSSVRPESGLTLDDITVKAHKRVRVDHVSLQVRPGEILGIAGVDGNGQKYLAEAIMGIRKTKTGHITLNGCSLDAMSIRDRKRLGIGYISDDRHRDGLIMDMGLSDNMLLCSRPERYLRRGLLSFSTLAGETQKAVEKYRIKSASLKMPVRYLSGGNQQKLILARELDEDVKLIIACQPTRGLDIGATETVRELLNDYKDNGCCVLLISADLNEIFSVSDRISVMHGGRIMGTVENTEQPDMTRIGLMMAGREMDA